MQDFPDDYRALVQFLQKKEAYSFKIEKPVEMLQTHISYVFLVDEVAYKIKKPLNFGFLDFRTLEKREIYCKKEFQYNQNFSPEIYLSEQRLH